jgi:MoaA/NifB/PqqE/SkfB family radical SAM enzyme
MSFDDLSRVFKSIRKLGVKAVSLTGGEPLIRNDLTEIVAMANSNRLSVDICTNGISLTSDRALELAEAGANFIILSLDTSNPKVYQKHRGVPFSFAERALDALKRVANEHPNTRCNVNCVITRHNIGQLVSLVELVSRYGEGRIPLNFQPYHCPPAFEDVSCELGHEMKNRLLAMYLRSPRDKFIPPHDCKPILEKEMEQLISLKRRGLPVANSESYLRGIPDFLFDKRLPTRFKCLAGYTGITIRYDLKVLPCWRLPPIGDLRVEKLDDIWFSRRYAERRKYMKDRKCQGCMLICHYEPSSPGFAPSHTRKP